MPLLFYFMLTLQKNVNNSLIICILMNSKRKVFLFLVAFLSLVAQNLFAFRINGKECFACHDTLFFTFNPDTMYVDSAFEDCRINGLSCDKVTLKVGNYKVSDSTGTKLLIITSLPLLEINVKSDSYLPNYKCDTCEMAVVEARLLDARGEERYSDALMKVRGAASSQYRKKSYSFELIDSTGNDYDTDWLGLTRSDGKYMLNAMYKDHSLMRNKVLMDIWNSFSPVHYLEKEPGVINGQRNEYLEVILNGTYNGIYTLGDKINRKFMKLKKYDEEKNKYKGLLFKSTQHDYYLYDREEASDSALTWLGCYEAKYPGKEGISGFPLLKKWLVMAKNNEFVPDVDYDFRNIVDYTIFINIIHAIDNERKNFYFACYNYNKEPKFFVIPWDLDSTLGRDYLGNEAPTELSDSTLLQFIAAFEENAFKSNLCFAVKRWNELKVGVLSPDSLGARLDSLANYIIASGAHKRNIKRWDCAKNGVYVDNDVEYIKNWYAKHFVTFDTYMSQFKDFEHAPRIVGYVEPTETEFGYSGDSVCFKCGEVFKQGEVLPMLPPVISSVCNHSAENVHVYLSDGLLVVENASDDVSVYNSKGELVARKKCNNSMCKIPLPNPDVYVVKVGGESHKVVSTK